MHICVRFNGENGSEQKGGKKCASNLPKRRIRKVFSLINISAKILAVFSAIGGDKNSTRFLSSHPSSLRCVYADALAMKEFISAIISSVGSGGVFWIESENAVGSLSLNGMRLEKLVPAYTRRRQTLVNNLLTLKEEDYLSLHVGGNDSSTPIAGTVGTASQEQGETTAQVEE